MRKTKAIIPLLLAVILLAGASCSSKKNTAKSRFWQAFTARYNTYYNGTLAYIDGSLEKENGNKDNYTEIIPLYTVGNKQSQQLGSGNFDRAIEKSQKAIKLHSINKRPEWTKNRRKTARDIEWLNRREYNPMMWKAWMLMGRSQFHKGAFDEAAATFSYMSRLYQTQPAIYGKARAWLAKCYIEQDWLYDAEDVIRNMSRDSIDYHAVKEWDYTYADYYIHTGEYEKAIPYLRKVIKHEMRKKQRAREWFLLGQMEAALGHRDLAYKAYKKVVAQNPSYELAFNARIAMTEVMAAGQAKKTISQLKRMAASDNNKDYLDQVYYAMGNVYLLEKDTANAIGAYEKGNEKSTRNGVEKGVLLLRLGDLYWEKEKFGDAQRCYGAAIGMLDKEREDYEELSHRSKILDELAPHTEAIHLQDSLLALSEMPEKERNEAIDRVIEALKKKEKEEKRNQAEAAVQQAQARNGGNMNRQQPPTTPQANQQQKGEWYFYNQMAVTQGKTAFQRQWGKRENEDNWQRSNKTVVSGLFDEEGQTEAISDSLAALQTAEDSLATVQDSAQNDPHKREYYLKDIPFTEEQKEGCHAIIADGLYNSGIIFKDKFDNLRLSEKQFNRLTTSYPEFEKMDDVYYHLFLLYSRKGDTMTADSYVTLLKEKFPESQWTTILTDPNFAENSKWGEQIEDSLYAATYNAFKASRYEEVFGNAHVSETRFPLGANRDKFIFIRGLSRLNNDDADGCLEDMNDVVKNYPNSRISEMAGMIVNGVKAGKQLRGGSFDLSDVWSRRSVVLSDSDSIAARTFVADRNKDFLFILAYHPDSLNENQLLYEMARFNFTTFIVRNFDIQLVDADGIHLMEISGFRNFDEAHQYATEVHKNANVVNRMKNARTIVISSDNLELLGKQYSYDDYDEFYAKHFAPLRVNTENLLNEPAEIGYEKEPDLKKPQAEEDSDGKLPSDDGQVIDEGGFDVNEGGGQDVNVDDGLDINDEGGQNVDVEEGINVDDNEVKESNRIKGNFETPGNTGVSRNTGVTGNTGVSGNNQLTLPDDNTGVTLPNNDDGFVIEDDRGNNPNNNDDGFVIEDNGGNNPNNNDDGFVIEDNGESNTNGNDDDGLIIEDRREVKKQNPTLPPTIQSDLEQKAITLPTSTKKTTPVVKQERPVVKQERPVVKQERPVVKQEKPVVKQEKPVKKTEQKTEPINPEREDTGIVFDDGFGEEPVPATPKKEKKKEKELEDLFLDDEYYELDGF